MKKTNIINKKTQEWIKNQLCYYHENYDIAEGYCDKGAEVILEGRYLCWKCATLKRKNKFWSGLFLIISFVIWVVGLILIWQKSWFSLLGLILALFSTLFILNLEKHFSFEHKGIVYSWNGFVCRHCPEKFLDEDKKLFAKHLKTKHPNEWNEIEEEIQQFPNNNKILKIEMPEILRKHKKRL